MQVQLTNFDVPVINKIMQLVSDSDFCFELSKRCTDKIKEYYFNLGIKRLEEAAMLNEKRVKELEAMANVIIQSELN